MSADANEDPVLCWAQDNGLDDSATQVLLDMPPEQQEDVLSKGPLKDARNPSAVALSRMRDVCRAAKEAAKREVDMNDLQYRLDQFLDEYQIDDRATQVLRQLDHHILADLLATPLTDVRNPSAVVLSRIRMVQEQQKKNNLGKGGGGAAFASSLHDRDFGRQGGYSSSFSQRSRSRGRSRSIRNRRRSPSPPARNSGPPRGQIVRAPPAAARQSGGGSSNDRRDNDPSDWGFSPWDMFMLGGMMAKGAAAGGKDWGSMFGKGGGGSGSTGGKGKEAMMDAMWNMMKSFSEKGGGKGGK